MGLDPQIATQAGCTDLALSALAPSYTWRVQIAQISGTVQGATKIEVDVELSSPSQFMVSAPANCAALTNPPHTGQYGKWRCQVLPIAVGGAPRMVDFWVNQGSTASVTLIASVTSAQQDTALANNVLTHVYPPGGGSSHRPGNP